MASPYDLEKAHARQAQTRAIQTAVGIARLLLTERLNDRGYILPSEPALCLSQAQSITYGVIPSAPGAMDEYVHQLEDEFAKNIHM